MGQCEGFPWGDAGSGLCRDALLYPRAVSERGITFCPSSLHPAGHVPTSPMGSAGLLLPGFPLSLLRMLSSILGPFPSCPCMLDGMLSQVCYQHVTFPSCMESPRGTSSMQ